MKSIDFICSFAKHICLSIENLKKNLCCDVLLDVEKRLKIDHFERGSSEPFPIAYDGTHMKLLNVEPFICNALTFFIHWSFNFYVFIVVQDLGPGHPSL